MNQTQHPFGDPSSTQYHQRDQLLVELARRASLPPDAARAVGRDPLAAVSGEIAVPVRHGWTVVGVALLVAALVACMVLAIAL